MAPAAAEVQAQQHIHSLERLLDHLESRRQHHRQLQEGAAAGRQDAPEARHQPSGAAQILIADDSQALLNAAQAAVSVLHSAGDCQQLWALCRAVLEECLELQLLLQDTRQPPGRAGGRASFEVLLLHLLAIARDLMEAAMAALQHAGDAPLLCGVARKLLQVGQDWIAAGDAAVADWLVSAARQAHTLCLDRVVNGDPPGLSAVTSKRAGPLFSVLPEELAMVAAEILLCILQLALVKGQRPAQVNSLQQLRALLSAPSTPLAVQRHISRALTALHLDSAGPLVQGRPQEAVRLLQQAMDVLDAYCRQLLQQQQQHLQHQQRQQRPPGLRHASQGVNAAQRQGQGSQQGQRLSGAVARQLGPSQATKQQGHRQDRQEGAEGAGGGSKRFRPSQGAASPSSGKASRRRCSSAGDPEWGSEGGEEGPADTSQGPRSGRGTGGAGDEAGPAVISQGPRLGRTVRRLGGEVCETGPAQVSQGPRSGRAVSKAGGQGGEVVSAGTSQVPRSGRAAKEGVCEGSSWSQGEASGMGASSQGTALLAHSTGLARSQAAWGREALGTSGAASAIARDEEGDAGGVQQSSAGMGLRGDEQQGDEAEQALSEEEAAQAAAAAAAEVQVVEGLRLQLLLPLLRAHINAGAHGAAAALSHAWLTSHAGFPRESGAVAACDASDAVEVGVPCTFLGLQGGAAGDQQQQQQRRLEAARGNGSGVCWDVWLLQVQCHCSLGQQHQAAQELRQALELGCGVKVAAAALALLLPSVRQAEALSAAAASALTAAVRAAVARHGAPAAELVATVVEALICADTEGGSVADAGGSAGGGGAGGSAARARGAAGSSAGAGGAGESASGAGSAGGRQGLGGAGVGLGTGASATAAAGAAVNVGAAVGSGGGDGSGGGKGSATSWPLQESVLQLLACDEVFGAVWASPARRRCHTALHSAGAAQYTAAAAHLPRVGSAASSHLPHTNNAQHGRRGTGRGTSAPVQGAGNTTGHTLGHTLMERARRLFIAALRFAPPGCYSATARMVAACACAVGLHNDALAYLGHADQQDPGSPNCHLIRIRALLGRAHAIALTTLSVLGRPAAESAGGQAGVGASTPVEVADLGKELEAQLEALLRSPDLQPFHLLAAVDEAMSVATGLATGVARAAGSGAGAGPRVQQKDTLAYEAVHRKELRYGDTASSSAAAAVLMAATRLVNRAVQELKRMRTSARLQTPHASHLTGGSSQAAAALQAPLLSRLWLQAWALQREGEAVQEGRGTDSDVAMESGDLDPKCGQEAGGVGKCEAHLQAAAEQLRWVVAELQADRRQLQQHQHQQQDDFNAELIHKQGHRQGLSQHQKRVEGTLQLPASDPAVYAVHAQSVQEVGWLAKAAMGLGIEAMQKGLWQVSHAAFSSCVSLCTFASPTTSTATNIAAAATSTATAATSSSATRGHLFPSSFGDSTFNRHLDTSIWGQLGASAAAASAYAQLQLFALLHAKARVLNSSSGGSGGSLRPGNSRAGGYRRDHRSPRGMGADFRAVPARGQASAAPTVGGPTEGFSHHGEAHDLLTSAMQDLGAARALTSALRPSLAAAAGRPGAAGTTAITAATANTANAGAAAAAGGPSALVLTALEFCVATYTRGALPIRAAGSNGATFTGAARSTAVTQSAAAARGGTAAAAGSDGRTLHLPNQAQALGAVLSCPGVTEADLQQLAALCLQQQPWRDVGMACALLGYALRIAQTSPQANARVVAQAICTLYSLSTSDAVKLKVCERAVTAFARPPAQQPAADAAVESTEEATGAATAAATSAAAAAATSAAAAAGAAAGASAGAAAGAAAAEPSSTLSNGSVRCDPQGYSQGGAGCSLPELHWLWVSCFNWSTQLLKPKRAAPASAAAAAAAAAAAGRVASGAGGGAMTGHAVSNAGGGAAAAGRVASGAGGGEAAAASSAATFLDLACALTSTCEGSGPATAVVVERDGAAQDATAALPHLLRKVFAGLAAAVPAAAACAPPQPQADRRDRQQQQQVIGAADATCSLPRPRVIGQQSDVSDAACDPLQPHAEGRQSAAADAACASAAQSPPAQLHQAWELQGRQVVGEECGAEGHRQLASRVDQEEQAGERAAAQEDCVDAGGDSEHEESLDDAGGDSEEVVAGTPPPEGSGGGGCAMGIVHKVPTGLVVQAQLRASSPGGFLGPEGDGLKGGKGVVTSLGPLGKEEYERQELVRAPTGVAAAADGAVTAAAAAELPAEPVERNWQLGADQQGADHDAQLLHGSVKTYQSHATVPACHATLPALRDAAQQQQQPQQQRRQPAIARRRFVAPVLSSAAPGVQFSTSGAAPAQAHPGTQARVQATTAASTPPLTLAVSAAGALGEAEAGAGAGLSPRPLGPGTGLNPKALTPRGLERTLVGLGIAVRPLRAEPDKLHVLDADELSIDDSGH